MNKTQALLASALIGGALTAVAQPASATPINLILNSLHYSYSGSGPAPTYADDNDSVSTSNAGYVTTLNLPYTFVFSGEGASVTPTRPLFVVEPQNSHSHPISSGVIQVTFGFLFGVTNYNLVENVNYYANLNTDYDTLIWQPGTNGTCTGVSLTSSCTYAFTIAGQGFSIEMDNETDWNMAQFDGASVAMAPTTVPEPLTLSLFGAGLAGAVGLRLRKKKAA